MFTRVLLSGRGGVPGHAVASAECPRPRWHCPAADHLCPEAIPGGPALSPSLLSSAVCACTCRSILAGQADLVQKNPQTSASGRGHIGGIKPAETVVEGTKEDDCQLDITIPSHSWQPRSLMPGVHQNRPIECAISGLGFIQGTLLRSALYNSSPL